MRAGQGNVRLPVDAAGCEMRALQEGINALLATLDDAGRATTLIEDMGFPASARLPVPRTGPRLAPGGKAAVHKTASARGRTAPAAASAL